MRNIIRILLRFLFSICLFIIMSCSYTNNSAPDPFNPPAPEEDDGDGTILQTRVGHKPADIIGGENVPKYTSDLIDHLYIEESNEGIEGIITSWNVENFGTFKWYYGTSGKWKEYTPQGKHQEDDDEGGYFLFTVTTGVQYFILEATSNDGLSKIYSNPLKIECGTEKTKKIGWIVYKTADGFVVKEDYKDEYGIPVGIVCDVNDDGTPKSYMAIEKSPEKLELCIMNSDFENGGLNFQTSLVDGSKNWKIICDAVSDEDLTDQNGKSYYPAFKYCEDLSADKSGNWFIPSRDEAICLFYNQNAINSGLAKLPASFNTSPITNNEVYWSSSLISCDYMYVFTIETDEGCYEDGSASYPRYVRPISRF